MIDKNFKLKILSNISIKLIPKELNIKSLNNKRYNISQYTIILIYMLENTSRIILIEYKIYFVYNLFFKAFVGIDTIKLEDIFLYYRLDILTINFYDGIRILIIITFKSEDS